MIVDSPTLDRAEPVEVVFSASGVPLGTQLFISVFSPELGVSTFLSSPLTGSLENSTATATVQFPPSVSQLYVQASW